LPNTLTSGVTIGRVQQGLVAQSAELWNQPTSAAVDRQAHGFAWRPLRPLRAQAQLQPFFDQASQARALLGGQGLGFGQQRVVEVERGLRGLPLK